MTDPAGPAVQLIPPGSFQAPKHFYSRVLNAQLHPLVRYFFSLDNEQIVRRYCHLHPEIKPADVTAALAYRPAHLRWAGADLFHATSEEGERRIVVIEVNSCPSGQKSMPLLEDNQEQAGYRRLLERSFLPSVNRRTLPPGGLAVLWDKNAMETQAYAAVLADLAQEAVHWVHFPAGGSNPAARFVDGILEVKRDGQWIPIRAAFRYVTQRPWNRIPPIARSFIYNPVLACLAGGRNKLLASKAYDFFNAELTSTRMQISTPETIWDVARDEVPLWVTRMGGVAVVKDPYSNAGQGVYTITNPAELDVFMKHQHRYGRFIVQGLVGNLSWSSRTRSGRLYHVGTIPDKKGEIYVADFRFMVGSSHEGFFPVALYARRSRVPLLDNIEDSNTTSWDMLGTNLSLKRDDGGWDTDSDRLMLMDVRDFNRLGLGMDDLIEAYLQTVLAVTAIDKLAQQLVTQKGKFRRQFFASINPDPALLEDICV